MTMNSLVRSRNLQRRFLEFMVVFSRKRGRSYNEPVAAPYITHILVPYMINDLNICQLYNKL